MEGSTCIFIKIRLGVELDGSQHKEKSEKLYDKDREKYLAASNIKIIRFWNSEVLSDTDSVLNKISERSSPKIPSPS